MSVSLETLERIKAQLKQASAAFQQLAQRQELVQRRLDLQQLEDEARQLREHQQQLQRLASINTTDHVKIAVGFRVEGIEGLEDVAVASGLHGYHLLLHFRTRAVVFLFKNLQDSKNDEQQHAATRTFTALLSPLT